MIDHFGLLAPLYDRVIGPPDPARLRDLLSLPDRVRLLDAGHGAAAHIVTDGGFSAWVVIDRPAQ